MSNPSDYRDNLWSARVAPATEFEDELGGVYYVTDGGQRYHYEWCHDCGGEGCDYCDGVGQVRFDG